MEFTWLHIISIFEVHYDKELTKLGMFDVLVLVICLFNFILKRRIEMSEK
jgi:hypothetical protein